MSDYNLDYLKSTAEDLKRTLVKLDLTLELYYDDSSLEGREMFVDCKLEQQNALDYTNDILRILRTLENN